MLRILKFPLTHDFEQDVLMPKNAVILSVQAQHGDVTIWAVCEDFNNGQEYRRFVCIFTGDEVPVGKFLATCQFHGGATVVHVFER